MGADTHWPRLFSTVSYWYFRLSSHFCWGKPSNESDMSQVCLRTLEHRTCSLFDNNDSYVMMLVIINRTKMPILNATTSYFPTSLSTSFAYLFPRLSWVVRRHVRFLDRRSFLIQITMIELVRSFISYSSYRARFTIRLKECLIRSLARILKYICTYHRQRSSSISFLNEYFVYSCVYIWCTVNHCHYRHLEDHVWSLETVFLNSMQSRSEIMQWNG